jgi:hypothetical protein
MKQGIDRDVLALLLLSLSKVDSTVVYEYETLCQYNDINRFRQDDYIVISYSKSDGGYKTIFNVPFSRKKALRVVITIPSAAAMTSICVCFARMSAM